MEINKQTKVLSMVENCNFLEKFHHQRIRLLFFFFFKSRWAFETIASLLMHSQCTLKKALFFHQCWPSVSSLQLQILEQIDPAFLLPEKIKNFAGRVSSLVWAAKNTFLISNNLLLILKTYRSFKIISTVLIPIQFTNILILSSSSHRVGFIPTSTWA